MTTVVYGVVIVVALALVFYLAAAVVAAVEPTFHEPYPGLPSWRHQYHDVCSPYS